MCIAFFTRIDRSIHFLAHFVNSHNHGLLVEIFAQFLNAHRKYCTFFFDTLSFFESFSLNLNAS